MKLLIPRASELNLVMYKLAHEKKIYGFTLNLDFNPLSTRFNLTKFLPTKLMIQTSFNTILIPCLSVFFSLDVLHTLRMYACRQKFSRVKSRRERVKV